MASTDNPIAELQRLLDKGEITRALFDQLSAPFRATVAGPGAVAQGPQAVAAGQKGIAIGGSNSAPIVAGTHVHITQAPQPRSLRDAYLARVWQRCDGFSLLVGGHGSEKLRLSEVYTALMTDHASAPAGMREGRPEFERPAPRDSALEALNAERRLVLLGEPGGGKSTFANVVAQSMAGELLGDHSLLPTPNLTTLTRPLPAERHEAEGQPKPAPQRWTHGALLPVIVVLRDLAAQLPAPGCAVDAQDVWQHISRDLERGSLSDYAGELRAQLQDRGGLIVFDGLDEVPEADTRREQIHAAVRGFAASFARCRILVTSRTYAYRQQDWKLPGFAEATLQPFSWPQIEAFVDRWYAHMVQVQRLTAESAEARRVHLLHRIGRNRDIAELAERPLLLTLLARLQSSVTGADVPEDLEQLYDSSVQMLLKDWEAAKHDPRAERDGELAEATLSDRLRAKPGEILRELSQLAFEAHSGQRGPERRDEQRRDTADIPSGQVVAALMRTNQSNDVNPARLRDYLRDRAGLLVERGVDMLTFPHRSFQEYLAACHLVRYRFPSELSRLARTEPSRWRDVTRLAAAVALKGADELATWALVHALCRGVPDARSDAADAWGALIAGEVLPGLRGFANPPHEHVDTLARLRRWQLALLATPLLPAAERALAGRTLATLGDPRPAVMTLEGMQFCFVQPGPFRRGEGKEARDVDLPYAYAIGRYPVTTAQWAQYLHESERQPADQDSLRSPGNEPATCLDWAEAMQVCEHLSRTWSDRLPAGWTVALPSNDEWEKAARGGLEIATEPQAVAIADVSRLLADKRRARTNPQSDRRWPWGSEDDADAANLSRTGILRTSAVGCFARHASALGCEEMAGNVWEWTRDEAAEGRYFVRGGRWDDVPDDARCAVRDHLAAGYRLSFLGFRVVLRSPPAFS